MTPKDKIKDLIRDWQMAYDFNEKMIKDAPGLEPLLKGSQAMLMSCIIELGGVL